MTMKIREDLKVKIFYEGYTYMYLTYHETRDKYEHRPALNIHLILVASDTQC